MRAPRVKGLRDPEMPDGGSPRLRNKKSPRKGSVLLATPPGFEPGLSDRKSEVLGLWTMGSRLPFSVARCNAPMTAKHAVLHY